MRITRLLLAAGVITVAAVTAGVGVTSVLAQDYQGSTVTIGGSASAVEPGDVALLAPGVTISGGDVSNDTGIGVAISGGSSVGSTTGGDTNASLVE